MKAILKDDQIIKLTISDDVGVEIGSIPRGVGLERLRFDGERIVDLVDLDSIWVEFINGFFILHCVPVRSSVLVEMNYTDTKRLVNDNGTIRLKTFEEEMKEAKQRRKDGEINRIRKSLNSSVGTDVERDILNDKLLYIMIKAIVDGTPEYLTFLSNYLTKMEQFVNIDKEKDEILHVIENKKNVINNIDQDVINVRNNKTY